MLTEEEFARRRLLGEGMRFVKGPLQPSFIHQDYESTMGGDINLDRYFVITPDRGQTIIQEGDWLFYNGKTRLVEIFRPI
jgi:hypothetical protein